MALKWGRGALAMAIVGLLTAGCAPTSTSGASAVPHTVSASMQRSLEALRDPWGLYVDPTYFDEAGSVYSTALLTRDAGSPPPQVNGRTLDELCRHSGEAKTVGEPWFSWSVAVVGDGRAKGCLNKQLPDATGDPNHDLPRLFAWVDSVSITGSLSKDRALRLVRPRLDALDISSVRSPYVMWRLDQIEERLGMTSSATSRNVPPPEALEGPDTLTEWWGYTMRCASVSSLCSDVAAPSDMEIAEAGIAYPDDLSLAGSIAILRARGARDLVRELLSGVRLRSDKNGLVRATRFSGSIGATYNVLRLDAAMFPGPDPKVSAAEIQRRLELVPKSDKTLRMKALAILKAVDEPTWRRREAEVKGIASSLESSKVGENNVAAVIEQATALGQMGYEVSPTLDIFDVRNDKSEDLALLVLANSWVFSNVEDIIRAYQPTMESAVKSVNRAHEPVAQYMLDLMAVGASDPTLSEARRQAIAKSLNEELRGCAINGQPAPDLYRFTLNKDSPCSLEVTVAATVSSFGGS